MLRLVRVASVLLITRSPVLVAARPVAWVCTAWPAAPMAPLALSVAVPVRMRVLVSPSSWMAPALAVRLTWPLAAVLTVPTVMSPLLLVTLTTVLGVLMRSSVTAPVWVMLMLLEPARTSRCEAAVRTDTEPLLAACSVTVSPVIRPLLPLMEPELVASDTSPSAPALTLPTLNEPVPVAVTVMPLAADEVVELSAVSVLLPPVRMSMAPSPETMDDSALDVAVVPAWMPPEPALADSVLALVDRRVPLLPMALAAVRFSVPALMRVPASPSSSTLPPLEARASVALPALTSPAVSVPAALMPELPVVLSRFSARALALARNTPPLPAVACSWPVLVSRAWPLLPMAPLLPLLPAALSTSDVALSAVSAAPSRLPPVEPSVSVPAPTFSVPSCSERSVLRLRFRPLAWSIWVATRLAPSLSWKPRPGALTW